MVITITLNGVKVKKEMPDSWDQVTYRQFLDLSKVWPDMTKTFALFTGIPEETLRKSKIENLYVAWECLSFLQHTQHEYHIPKRISTGKKTYDLPQDLEVESTGQFQDLASICSSFVVDDPTNLEKYPLIIATYVLPNYSFKDAEALAPEFFNSPCQEVLAIGNFTLARLSALQTNPNPISLPVVTRVSRLKRVMRNWLNSLASSARLILWRKRQIKAGMNY